MTELKPCPFCGGRADLVLVDGCESWRAHIECTECGAESPTVWWMDDEDFKGTAVKKWNRRVEE